MHYGLPVELKNRSSFDVRVAAYLILRPRIAFCNVNVIKLTYFKVFLFSFGSAMAERINDEVKTNDVVAASSNSRIKFV